jgi:hypothetical protein
MVAKLIQHNKSLKYISAKKNWFGVPGAKLLAEAMENNNTLLQLQVASISNPQHSPFQKTEWVLFPKRQRPESKLV